MKYKTILIICLIFCCGFSFELANEWTKCPVFCGLNGQIPDSNCSVYQLDLFNKQTRYILKQILEKPYFRFYKTQLSPFCSFWPSADQCFGQGCSVHTCSSTDLPDHLKRTWDETAYRYTHSECEENDPLGRFDMTKGGENCKGIKRQEAFCEIQDDENEDDSVFLDLQRNPERFTGYRGESSWRIWRAIYSENCFWSNPAMNCGVLNKKRMDSSDEELCFENQLFYNVISGFHASVNVHVCAEFFFPGKVLSNRWGYNLPEFKRRFGSELTNCQGTRYLKNLYFLYLLELKAIIKAEPYIKQLRFDDDDLNKGAMESECNYQQSITNTTTRHLIDLFFDKIKKLECQFDEDRMFRVESAVNENNFTAEECVSKAIRDTFRTKFANITKILDCVACDKCRMWGRLQMKSVGTAFNILFHDRTSTSKEYIPPLSHTQVVALLNGFGRCAESLDHIAHFRKMSNENFHSEL